MQGDLGEKATDGTVKELAVKAFFVLGVLGKLVPLPFLGSSFRFYFLLLPLFIVILMVNGMISVVTVRAFIASLPLFVYCLFSSFVAYFRSGDQANENPVLRLAILFMLFITSMLTASYINLNYGVDIRLKFELVRIYLMAFCVTAVVGLFFFVGYNCGFLELKFIETFQVQVQFGAGGLLRVSPGSYPNEYGIVSSFALSAFTLCFIHRKDLEEQKACFVRVNNSLFIAVAWILSLVVLFLTTTRSAYISYILSLLYIIFSRNTRFRFRKLIICASLYNGRVK